MEIFFASKDENNKRREEEFLKLSPGERLMAFIDMICAPPPTPLPDDYVHPNDAKGNFVIRKKRIERNFNKEVYDFIKTSNRFGVKMIMVEGSAVNYYGYKRHSADIDFWIDNSGKNLNKLLKVVKQLGYELDSFPKEVISANQNVSLKFSPDVEIELITRFNPGKSFQQAFDDCVEFVAGDEKYLKWNIISFDDLINSKMKAGRPKDLLDVQELKRIRGKE